MELKRELEIRELAERTKNRNIISIYDGGYTNKEIEFFLEVRASLNNKNKGIS